MDMVNVYLYTTVKGPRKRAGAYAYILEIETAKGPATLSKTEYMKEATEHQAELQALIAALKRLTKPCALSIYTDSEYLAGALERGWIAEWKKKDWKNAKGQPVAHMSEWQEMAELLNAHCFLCLVGRRHSYYTWMQQEARKKMEENKDV